jgi:hypothetical protein
MKGQSLEFPSNNQCGGSIMNTNINSFSELDAFRPLLGSFINSANNAVKDKALLPGFQNAHDAIILIVGKYYDQAEQIRQEFADGRLTSKVKAERMNESRLAAEVALEDIRDLSTRQKQIETVLFAVPLRSDADRIIAAMIQKEIRDALRHMDALQVTSFILTELDKNPESEILEAMTQVPDFLKKITSEQERGYLKQRGLARNPQLAEELSDVETINGLIQGMKVLAKTAIQA